MVPTPLKLNREQKVGTINKEKINQRFIDLIKKIVKIYLQTFYKCKH